MARSKEIDVTTRLGDQVIERSKVIHFPHGLKGLENMREFTLLQIREDAPFLLLQSLEDPGLGLLVTDPYSFIDTYKIKVSDAEQFLLNITDAGQVAVLVTVSIPNGKPEKTTLNLTGPILINHEARLGLQVPQSDPTIPSQVYLYKKDEDGDL